jgi:hypothetical protein
MSVKRRHLVLVSLLFVGLGGCLAGFGYWVVWWFVIPQEVSLRCESAEDGRPQFALSAHRIEGIDSFLFWSDTTDEPLWAFRIGPTRVSPNDLQSFRYGLLPQVPDPQLRRVKQVFPRDGEPRPVAPGEKFFVRVEYSYDSMRTLSPCRDAQNLLFEMRPDGSVAPLVNREHGPLPSKVQDVWLKLVSLHEPYPR